MLELFLEYRVEVQQVFAWLVCLIALLWGGGPERVFSIVWIMIVKIIHPAYHEIFDLPFQLSQLDFFHALLDFSLAVAFVWLALNANRFYPLWLAAFQIIAVGAHLVRELIEIISPIVYAILAIAPSYFQLLIFAGGLAFHLRRKKRYGAYRDWRQSAHIITLQSIFQRMNKDLDGPVP